jgi:hypothetical protein
MKTTLSALKLSSSSQNHQAKNKAKAIIQMRHESRRLAQRFKIPSNSLIIEVRDARLPLSSVASPFLSLTSASLDFYSASKTYSETVAASATVIPTAERLLVFNKADLADSNRILVIYDSWGEAGGMMILTAQNHQPSCFCFFFRN